MDPDDKIISRFIGNLINRYPLLALAFFAIFIVSEVAEAIFEAIVKAFGFVFVNAAAVGAFVILICILIILFRMVVSDVSKVINSYKKD